MEAQTSIQENSTKKITTITMRDRANDEILNKVNQLTDERQISIINSLLDKPFYDLSYLDATFFRDILRLDLNDLVINFAKGI